MKLEINIDEEYITELVSQEIAKRIVNERTYENGEARIGARTGVDKAVKDYLYSRKEEIIEKVIERASREIVKKGLPKLLENLGKEL